MKGTVFLSGAIAAILCGAPTLSPADDLAANSVNTVLLADAATGGDVDAGGLIGQGVYDGMGEKVGEIDSVMVDPKGRVTSVVIDVGGWLESEKLVAVAWSDLKPDPSGKILSSLTKESAAAAASYAYKDPTLRRQVLTESGERYAVNGAPAGTTQPATTAAADASAGDPVVNADGSLNASKLIGLDVQSPEGKKVRDIGEIVLAKGGTIEGVIVDVGGFLGIGSHPVRLDWKDVTLAARDGNTEAIVNLTQDKLEQMPAYQSSSN